MKACNQLIELSFCVVCALAPSALWTLNADPINGPPQKAITAANHESIFGSVTAKDDSSLTVSGKIVAISADTSFTKDGRAAALADIPVGGKVKVVATRNAAGDLQAVSVGVMANDLTLRRSD